MASVDTSAVDAIVSLFGLCASYFYQVDLRNRSDQRCSESPRRRDSGTCVGRHTANVLERFASYISSSNMSGAPWSNPKRVVRRVLAIFSLVTPTHQRRKASSVGPASPDCCIREYQVRPCLDLPAFAVQPRTAVHSSSPPASGIKLDVRHMPSLRYLPATETRLVPTKNLPSGGASQAAPPAAWDGASDAP